MSKLYELKLAVATLNQVLFELRREGYTIKPLIDTKGNIRIDTVVKP